MINEVIVISLLAYNYFYDKKLIRSFAYLEIFFMLGICHPKPFLKW